MTLLPKPSPSDTEHCVLFPQTESCKVTIPTQGEKQVLAKGGPSTNTLGSAGLSHLWSGGVWAVRGDPGSGSTFLTQLPLPDDGSMYNGPILEVRGLEGLSAHSLKLFCSVALWPLRKCWQSHGMKASPCAAWVVLGSVIQAQVF